MNRSDGGSGAVDLGKAVVSACEKSNASNGNFKFLYDVNSSIEEKAETICRKKTLVQCHLN